MRKLMIGGLMVLCSVIAFGQDEPQWRVIKHVTLLSQSQSKSETLLVPTDPGVYRLTLYFSGGRPGINHDVLVAQLNGLDITNASIRLNSQLSCNQPSFSSSQITTILKPNQQLDYYVIGQPNAPIPCQYNLAITVEQLLLPSSSISFAGASPTIEH